MTSIDPLILDLLEWLTAGSRSYTAVMETWRTACPNLTVWEEAETRGYVTREHIDDHGEHVEGLESHLTSSANTAINPAN